MDAPYEQAMSPSHKTAYYIQHIKNDSGLNSPIMISKKLRIIWRAHFPGGGNDGLTRTKGLGKRGSATPAELLPP